MNNVVVQKSFNFSVRIVNLYKHLRNTKKEHIMSKQLLRSGTSIGANIAESQQAQSHADFISKLSIALKEAEETEYWLRLLHQTNFLTQMQFLSIHADCVELKKILVSILKSSKQ